MDKKVDNLIKIWQKRNIQGIYCDNKQEAAEKILEIIPESVTIGRSGSLTLDQLGIVKRLEERGNKVFNQYKSGISSEESSKLRKQGSLADYYLSSANAISEQGELVFFSAYGVRIAGICDAKNLIVVCGINKITPSLEEAIKRGREYVAPLNCKRLNWNSPCFEDGICHSGVCLFPEYKRMCCQILIVEAEAAWGRLKVILVAEPLGF